MKIKNFNLVIVLIAEILVAVYGYYYRYSLERLAITMGIVFIIFFIIGSILQAMSNRLLAEVEAKEIEEREAMLAEESQKTEESLEDNATMAVEREK